MPRSHQRTKFLTSTREAVLPFAGSLCSPDKQDLQDSMLVDAARCRVACCQLQTGDHLFLLLPPHNHSCYSTSRL